MNDQRSSGRFLMLLSAALVPALVSDRATASGGKSARGNPTAWSAWWKGEAQRTLPEPAPLPAPVPAPAPADPKDDPSK